MSGMLDQLLAEYEAAARRIAALHRRWERMALSDPLERGQDAWHMRQGQLDLEDQIRKLWDDYIEKDVVERVVGGRCCHGPGDGLVGSGRTSTLRGPVC
jgi:hypothetical protein